MRQLFTLLTLALAAATLAAIVQADEVKIDHNGITMNASLVTSGDNWKEEDVLLMTHGTLAHGQMEIMATLQELLLERGISSLAITLSLGQSNRHGMYDCKVPHNHKHADAIDEIGLWLNWLDQQGAKQITLLGHSRGGNQTAMFASAANSPSVNKIVLVAPSILSDNKPAKDFMARFGKPVDPLLAEATALVEAGKSDQLIENINFIYCEESSATAGSIVGYYAPDPGYDTPSVIRNIGSPVLVIAGSEDEVVTDLENRLAPLADNEKITLVLIDGADHFFRDLYAEEMVDAIEVFLSE